eukprot:UC1_evm1s559
MTPTRQAVIDYGICKDQRPGDALLDHDNIDKARMRHFARSVASFFGLPDVCKLVSGRGDVQLFDFSSRTSCSDCCRVQEAPGGAGAVADYTAMPHLATFVIGDSLLEPFWPEGL